MHYVILFLWFWGVRFQPSAPWVSPRTRSAPVAPRGPVLFTSGRQQRTIELTVPNKAAKNIGLTSRSSTILKSELLMVWEVAPELLHLEGNNM